MAGVNAGARCGDCSASTRTGCPSRVLRFPRVTASARRTSPAEVGADWEGARYGLDGAGGGARPRSAACTQLDQRFAAKCVHGRDAPTSERPSAPPPRASWHKAGRHGNTVHRRVDQPDQQERDSLRGHPVHYRHQGQQYRAAERCVAFTKARSQRCANCGTALRALALRSPTPRRVCAWR